jgi:DNA-binding XRE family transcriptional regulator
MVWNSPRDGYSLERLLAFGRNIRRARRCAGYSQQRLSDLSGVSQTVISRLERGRAPRLGLERILALHEVLGGCLPLGTCPHDHSCIWKPQSAQDDRARHAPGPAVGLGWPEFQPSPTETTPPNRLRTYGPSDSSAAELAASRAASIRLGIYQPSDFADDDDTATDDATATDANFAADDSAGAADLAPEDPSTQPPRPTETTSSNRLGPHGPDPFSAGKLAARAVDLVATAMTSSDPDTPD